MLKTIEVNDVLWDDADSAVEEITDLIIEQIKGDYPETCPDCGFRLFEPDFSSDSWHVCPQCLEEIIEMPDLSDLDYDGSVHEIIDGCVPIYTNEIETAWFLHGNDLEEAYDHAGIGENPRENSGMTAIYCFIQNHVYEWFSGIELGDPLE